MDDISKSVSLLSNLHEHYVLVDNFARNEYNEKFKDIKLEPNGFHHYFGYDIVSSDEIKVNYLYGRGRIEYEGSFNVKIYRI
jgi:hypothetical protein